jgi:protein-S-isoprenylcysteine O-methyltransferase Ste14
MMESTPEQLRDDVLALRARNFCAAAFVVALACAIFLLAPYNRPSLAELYGPPEFAFTGDRFVVVAAAVYVVLLAIYYFTDPAPAVSKPLRFVRYMRRFLAAPIATVRGGISNEDRLALLSTLLKGFFGPLMTKSLMGFCMNAWVNLQAAVAMSRTDASWFLLFDSFGFWALMQAILFVDVFFFTVGYLVESRRFGNEIRSVDPTLIGWLAAMMCYPPFNQLTATLLGTQRSDFPQFDDPTVHVVLNVLLLVLMAIYASASAALGLKASNLTHRGIVARGPYAVIRHPAYTCKNLAWWIGAIPLVSLAFQQSFMHGLASAGSVVAWSSLYVLRALTEEDHLRSVDGEYAAYAAKVKYRFIPGVI